MNTSAVCLLVLLPLSITSTAFAQDVPGSTWSEGGHSETAESAESTWRLAAGYRGAYVPSAGFDPFATDDSLAQFSVLASRTVFARGPFSFAPGLAWNYGTTSATARGDAAELRLHRLSVPLEGRLHVGPLGSWGYAFVRVAPGVVGQTATLEDDSSPAPLTKTRWVFATDVSGGYAWPLFPWPMTRAHDAPRVAHLWLEADGGYGWAASERLDLHPDLPSGSDDRVAGVDLGSLSTSGAFFRVALAVSY